MSSSPIWHSLSTLSVSATAAAPMGPVHLLPSVNIWTVPSSLALSYVVLATSWSSRHTIDGADHGAWIDACRLPHAPGGTASREICRHLPFFHTWASIGIHTPFDVSAAFRAMIRSTNFSLNAGRDCRNRKVVAQNLPFGLNDFSIAWSVCLSFPFFHSLYILNTFCIFMPFMVPISAQRGHEPEFVHSRHFAIVVHQPLRISCAHLAVTTPMMRGLNQHAAQLSSSAIFVHQKNRAPSSFPFLPILLSRVSTDPGRRSTLRIFFTFREFQLILVENTHRAHFREPQLILIGGEHRAFWPAQKPHFHAQPSQHLNKSKYAPWPTTPHGDLQHGGFA